MYTTQTDARLHKYSIYVVVGHNILVFRRTAWVVQFFCIIPAITPIVATVWF